MNEMPRESKKKRGENDDDLWETPTFSLTDEPVRALDRLTGEAFPSTSMSLRVQSAVRQLAVREFVRAYKK